MIRPGTDEFAPQFPCLTPGEVHLWWASLDVPEATAAALDKVLSTDEHERAMRFVFPRDRRRFVVARATLRRVLARYLAREPAEIRFAYGSRGKPRLRPASAVRVVEFNVAHSNALVVCAVSCNQRVGVDLEQLRPMHDLPQVAAVAFSRSEQKKLFGLAPEQQLLGFFNCWTRKEAYVKARGDGLFLDLDAFDVSLAPGEPAALLAHRLDPGEVGR